MSEETKTPVVEAVVEERKPEPVVEKTPEVKESPKHEAKHPKPGKRFFLHRMIMPIVYWLVFSIVFWLVAKLMIVDGLKEISNERVLDLSWTYYAYVGVAAGLLSMIGGYIVLLIAKLLRVTRWSVTFPFIATLMTLPWLYFGWQLLFRENHYTDIQKAIIAFLGKPFYYTAIVMLVLIGVWVLGLIARRLFGKKAVMAAATLLIAPLVLSGCVGDIEGVLCDMFPDSDHCFQNAAISEGQDENCEKIKGEGFKSSGSNPPKDKCYLLIAENTGDLSKCDQIKGGLMSYTREECILGSSIKNENASGCKLLTGSAYTECANAVGAKLDPWKIMEVDTQIKQIQDELKNGPDKNLEDQLKGLTTKRKDMLDVSNKKTKDDYAELSDPVNQQITGDYALGDIDKETKDSLLALNKDLRSQGLKLTDQQYKSVRDYMAYKNDPDNDIENMDETKMVQKRWNEKLGSAVDSLKFWKTKDSAAEQQLDQQMLIYTRMAERQAAINKGLSEYEQDVERDVGIVIGGTADYAGDKVKDAIIKHMFGSATETATSVTTKVLGEALDTVKAEAKSKEFRGLVRAYNMAMAEEVGAAGGNVEKAHAAVVKKMYENPYQWEDQNTLAKYGNLVENKTCDGTNPHCIDHEVFWKAMKKSYSFQHK